MKHALRYGALAILALFVGSLAFAAVAAAGSLAGAHVAQTSAAGTSSPDTLSAMLDLLRPIYDAFAHGNYVYAGALALVLAVALTKRYLGGRVPWLHSEAGNTTLMFLGALGAAFAATMSGGGSLTLAIAKHALAVAVAATGGFYALAHLLVGPLTRLRDKSPAWLRPAFNLVLWIFSKPDPVATAEAAGQAAVEAKPPTGIAGTLGKPRDLP